MKKTIRLFFLISFILVTIIGCNKKEIILEPIAESALAEYLKGKDPALDSDDFTGTYTIISRVCDKKTDDLMVSYNGSSALFDYQAKYQVKSTATENGWIIDSFDVVESDYQMKDLPPSIFKDLLEGVDKNVTFDMGGTYSLVSKEVKDNVVKFVVKYTSDDGKYSAEYDGEAVVKDGKLELQKVVVNTISSDSEDPNGDNTSTLSNNYDPNKKAADYGYKAPKKPTIKEEYEKYVKLVEEYRPGFKVTKMEYLSHVFNMYFTYEVTLEKRLKYVTEVEEWKFTFSFKATGLQITNKEKISNTTNSNFEGVYVNKANGSYIIMHENWKFVLHEFYLDNGTIKEAVLKEFHRISGTSMKWQNRKYAFKSVWTNGKEPEYFAVTILNINEIRLDTDILSSKSGDIFVKVE